MYSLLQKILLLRDMSKELILYIKNIDEHFENYNSEQFRKSQ